MINHADSELPGSVMNLDSNLVLIIPVIANYLVHLSRVSVICDSFLKFYFYFYARSPDVIAACPKIT